MRKYKPASILAKSKGRKNKISNSAASEAAAALGKRGGKAGGPARAAALSSDQLHDIAKHAANVRWGEPCLKNCPYCGGYA
jgi:hypothetical protein